MSISENLGFPPALGEVEEEAAPEAEAPQLETVNLGGRVVELEPDKAAEIRAAFGDLSQQYGATLEQQKQSFRSMGQPGWQAPAQQVVPQETPGFDIPDPDLLFSNKEAWRQGTEAALEARLAREKAERLEMAQGMAQAVSQELNQREQAAQTRANHDRAWEAMIERRGLQKHRDIAGLIYNENFRNPQLAHLPFDQAFDHMGAWAEARLNEIRGRDAEAAPERPAAQTPPPMLRSSRKAGGHTAAKPAAEPYQGSLSRALLKAQEARGF